MKYASVPSTLIFLILLSTLVTMFSWKVGIVSSQGTRVQVHIEVLDASSGSPIRGADVVWDGAYVGSTDANGGLWITTTYPPATHSYQVMISGYEPTRGSITIGANSGGGFTVRLTRSGPTTAQVYLWIEVLDDSSGSRISGASVYWDGSYVGLTGSDGRLRIDTVYPPASHGYRVTASGYNEKSGSITIGASSGGGVTVRLTRDTTPVTIRGTYTVILAPASYAEMIRRIDLVQKLDRAYQLLEDLTGIVPYNGEKIKIILDPDFQGGAIAGNPIRISTGWKEEDFANVIYHEMAHDFMGIAEFDRLIFPSDPFVEGFGELGRQYILYQVDPSTYGRLAAQYLRELKEQYLDPELPFEALRQGPSAGILQDLTNRYGFGMWKRFFRTIYDLDLGPKENRTLKERCLLFVSCVSEAAGEDLTDYFKSLRFPID